MRDRDRRRPDPEQPLSAGRVEYLEQARRRVRARRLRRTVAVVLVLAAAIAFGTGMVGTSVARAKDLVDSARIALTPDPGWPQQTGVMELRQMEPLDGGFVVLGEEGCFVYSEGGSRLNAIQSSYARPALAAGRTRFVLYDRSGRELRVESRTQNLYTKTMENDIYLCAVADDGRLAVVTDDVRSVAELLVYSPSMEQQLTWGLTAAEGIPVRMAFSPDSRRLAVAAVTASAGQVVTNLYVLPLGQGDPVQIGSRGGSAPQWLEWTAGDRVLLLYEDCALLYDAAGGECARYEFGGRSLVSVSSGTGGTALLLSAGQTCEAVLLDGSLGVQYNSGIPSAERIVRAGDSFYLLTDDEVECWSLTEGYQWSRTLEARPQALLAGRKRTLVFCGNTVQELTPPEAEEQS
ncbi:MAG: DUF5711 family protein [Faecalibacterium sp.]